MRGNTELYDKLITDEIDDYRHHNKTYYLLQPELKVKTKEIIVLSTPKEQQ